jgi:sortase A
MLGGDAVDKVIDFLRRKRWARRTLTGGCVGLLILAVVLLGYPIYTNFVHNRLQGKLGKQLESQALKDAYQHHALHEGDSLTRLIIPKLGVNVVVVEGVSTNALQAGAGHYPATPMPCQDGNMAIAGHRTTYGKPFANVDRLAPGDQMTLVTPVGSCVYQLSRAPFVVQPTDIQVVANTRGQHNLTLTSCHPRGSAAERIIIRASMVSSSVA